MYDTNDHEFATCSMYTFLQHETTTRKNEMNKNRRKGNKIPAEGVK